MKLATAVAGLVLTVLTSSVNAQQSIMVIGDSLSAGVERPSYRKPLLDDLASLDCAVDMVGTRALNSFSLDNPDSQPDAHFRGFEPGAGYDTDHQAFSGMRVAELLSGAAKAGFVAQPMANYTANAQPDFILLHLGTDDLYATIDSGVISPAALDRWAEKLSSDIETMIRQIIERHETPSALRILVGNFVPYSGPFTEQAQRSAAAAGSAILRNKIESRIREMRDSRVLIVDVASGFDIESMSTVNAVPNAAGEQHIAGAFLAVLRGAGLCPDSAPSISKPNTGSILDKSIASITWQANDLPVEKWRVYVGDTQSGDSASYFDSGELESGARSVQISTLPEDGSTVFVSLMFFVDGIWDHVITSFSSMPEGTQARLSTDTQLVETVTTTSELITGNYATAANGVNTYADNPTELAASRNTSPVSLDLPDGSIPAIISPAPGTQFTGSEVLFRWTANDTNVEEWYLRAGLTANSNEFADVRIEDSSVLQYRLTGLPDNGVPVFIEFSYRSSEIWTRQTLQYRSHDASAIANQPPVAIDDTAGPIWNDTSLVVDVTNNDSDTDGQIDPRSVNIVMPPLGGLVAVQPDGQIVYTYNNTLEIVQDVLTYTVSDNDGLVSNEASLTISPINGEDVIDLAMHSPIPGTQLPGTDVTFQWSSKETSVRQWYLRAGLSAGTTEFADTRINKQQGQQHRITGLPSNGETVFVELSHKQSDSWYRRIFKYQAYSGRGTGNQSPVATDDSAGPLASGQSLGIEALENDTDVDGAIDPSTLVLTSPPTAGSAAVQPNGQILYAHNGNSTTGSDSLTYTVEDNDGATSNTATVTITPISNPGSVLPAITSPLPGTQLSDNDVLFTWASNAVDVDQWYLRVGLSAGATQFADVRITDATARQYRVTGLPANGVPVFVEFSYLQASGWATRSFQYRAMNGEPTSTPSPAPSPSPTPSPTPAPNPTPDTGNTVTTPLLVPLDITYNNPSWSGNPYDLLATATFTHANSSRVRRGEFFYAGNNRWTVRFVADAVGTWRYTTQSRDAELDNHTGSVSVTNSTEKGFVVTRGDKWARSATGEAFVPQYVMASTLAAFGANPAKLQRDLNTFIDGHGFTGFHIRGYCHWFKLGSDRCNSIPAGQRDPDPATFEVIENIIMQTNARGGATHIWMYGDNSRKQNPSAWGLNGREDQRMQRYLAARLGALPGWTIGYGYDVVEWASRAQMESWYKFLDDRMMYPHLTGARGNTNQIMQHSNVFTYSAYEQHNPDYAWYARALADRRTKPSFAEDRYRIDAGRSVDYTVEETRRGLWHSAMAGGVANIWGNMQFDEGGSYDAGSRAYPNKRELKVYSDFMTPRFRRDFQNCNSLTDGYCLRTPAHTQYIVYKEDTRSIRLDLRNMTGSIRYTAMDTRTGSKSSGTFQRAQQQWTAPYVGDWALEIIK